ncbi:hypothetical protein E5288_WYG011893 [Bos mutus]|uniref:Uncharacterized protein n=1 Tax=Bos mutus TaxID=72004 RepID=A0A6B0QUY6_9CETA|nr:hypothetical protein [Bos mutus]
MKEAMVQTEGAAAEITRKQEMKHFKNEKKWLAAIALESSENSRSTPEEGEETSERPKKKKEKKCQQSPQENGMEDPAVSFSKPKEKKYFFKEKLVSSDLEDRAGSGIFPKGRNLFQSRTS